MIAVANQSAQITLTMGLKLLMLMRMATIATVSKALIATFGRNS